MGYPARTFYKCIGFDYRDLYQGTIDFKPYIGGDPFRLTGPMISAISSPVICSSDVVHASPRPEQAAHYATHAIRFTRHGMSPLSAGPRDPRLRMVECHGRPVVHDPDNVPKYGFRELTLLRVIPPMEILEMLLDAEYFGAQSGNRKWMTIGPGRSEYVSPRIHQFVSIYFPYSGRLHRKHWSRRPRLPMPAN